MKKTVLALLLCCSLLLSGCSAFSIRLDLSGLLPPDIHTEAPTIEPSTKPTSLQESEPTAPSQGEHTLNEYVPYEDFERPFVPYLDEKLFSELEYERPDTKALCDGYAEVQAMVERGESVDDIVDAYALLFEDYLYFDTMSTYAYICYTLDLNDSYYDEEYNWCEEQSPVISQAEEKCHIAMAKSPLRDELEDAYFDEDFFEFYDENEIYSKDRVVELMQEESELQAEYMALQSDMTVTWKGEEVLVDDLFNDDDLPYEDYLQVYELYYEKYNPLCAELYIKLINTRKAIAKELGYDSYADFAYFYYYERDYSPEQVERYCNAIAEEMEPLLFTAVMSEGTGSERSTEEVMELLGQTANTFGGAIRTAYEYMMDYGLYDITESSSKMPGSYMTYLSSYEMPFLYVSPTGALEDYLTAVHEFGHFIDGYVNCGGATSVDCAEIFSQGLEYLSLNRAELSAWEKEALAEAKAADSVMTFLSQACYAEFEQRAFELPEGELNAEGLNKLFLECNEKYGMSMLYYGTEELLAPGWVDVQHFFIAPFYVISYCVSNDAALQIYQKELQNGNGLDTYYELLTLPSESSLLSLLREAGMDSPFSAGRVADLADFLDEQMN